MTYNPGSQVINLFTTRIDKCDRAAFSPPSIAIPTKNTTNRVPKIISRSFFHG